MFDRAIQLFNTVLQNFSMFTRPFEVSYSVVKDRKHATGETLVFQALVKMTEIMHRIYGQKLKYVPLSSDVFQTCGKQCQVDETSMRPIILGDLL